MIGDAVPFRRQHAAERGHRPGDADARNSSGWESRSSPASKRRLQKNTLIVIRSPHTQNDKNFCGGRSMPRLYSGKRVSSCVHTHTNSSYMHCVQVRRAKSDLTTCTDAVPIAGRFRPQATCNARLLQPTLAPISSSCVFRQLSNICLAPSHPHIPAREPSHSLWKRLIRFPSTRRSSPDSPR